MRVSRELVLDVDLAAPLRCAGLSCFKIALFFLEFYVCSGSIKTKSLNAYINN